MPRALHVAEPIQALRPLAWGYAQDEPEALCHVAFNALKELTQKGELRGGQRHGPAPGPRLMLRMELAQLSREALMRRLWRQLNCHVPTPLPNQ